MKKVLVFGIRCELGGMETFIMNYYKNFDKKRVHIDFISIDDKMIFEDELSKMGSKIFKMHPKIKYYFKNRREMKSFFEENAHKYDAIWVNMMNLVNIDYLKYAKKYGIKKRIVHSHNSSDKIFIAFRILHEIYKKKIGKYATDFWGCSKKACEWFYPKDILNSKKCRVINNAIDYDKFKYDENVRKKYRKENGLDDKLVFCHVGRMCYQKNQEFLIDIFSHVVKKEKNAILLLVGDGVDRSKLEEKVKDLELKNNVRFLGVQKDVASILQACDVFVFPSVYEGLPISLVEVQASHLPVFASDTISNESKMSECFFQYPLTMDPEKWANEILKKYKKLPERSKRKDYILERGYNIKIEAKKLQQYF